MEVEVVGLLASPVRAMAAAAYFVGMAAVTTAVSIELKPMPSSTAEEERCGLRLRR